MTRLCPENKIKFAIICTGNHMISSAICRNKHEYIFQRSAKLHGSVRQVQFAVFELNYECTFIPNCNKHFFILIDHKKYRFLKQSVHNRYRSKNNFSKGQGQSSLHLQELSSKSLGFSISCCLSRVFAMLLCRWFF